MVHLLRHGAMKAGLHACVCELQRVQGNYYVATVNRAHMGLNMKGTTEIYHAYYLSKVLLLKP